MPAGTHSDPVVASQQGVQIIRKHLKTHLANLDSEHPKIVDAARRHLSDLVALGEEAGKALRSNFRIA